MEDIQQAAGVAGVRNYCRFTVPLPLIFIFRDGWPQYLISPLPLIRAFKNCWQLSSISPLPVMERSAVWQLNPWALMLPLPFTFSSAFV
jgi:hypothetical protein